MFAAVPDDEEEEEEEEEEEATGTPMGVDTLAVEFAEVGEDVMERERESSHAQLSGVLREDEDAAISALSRVFPLVEVSCTLCVYLCICWIER